MKVFVTGATGYIGGAVAEHLMDHGHEVRGLTRDPDKMMPLKRLGITPVLGDLDDRELLIQESRRADAVINAASTLHRGAVEALVDGLRGSNKPVIHTSGIGMLSDDACGDRLSDQIFDEDSPIVIGPHPMQKALRDIETIVLNAAASSVRSIVLSNTMIYGAGRGLSAESTQLPMMVRQAQASGVASVVGAGVNRWSNAHIDDVAALYVLALEGGSPGSFYFVETGEASFAEIAEAIAARLGLGPVRHLTLAEAGQAYGEMPARYLLGTNSRVRGTHAKRDLGWSPQHGSITDWIAQSMSVDDDPLA